MLEVEVKGWVYGVRSRVEKSERKELFLTIVTTRQGARRDNTTPNVRRNLPSDICLCPRP